MSPNEPDYYEILQVSPNAEQLVIEAAYRRLAREYHPDVNENPDATERMRHLNQAFEVLGNPEKRAEYDRRRKTDKGGYSAPSPPSPARTRYSLAQLAVGVLVSLVVFVIVLWPIWGRVQQATGVGVSVSAPTKAPAPTALPLKKWTARELEAFLAGTKVTAPTAIPPTAMPSTVRALPTAPPDLAVATNRAQLSTPTPARALPTTNAGYGDVSEEALFRATFPGQRYEFRDGRFGLASGVASPQVKKLVEESNLPANFTLRAVGTTRLQLSNGRVGAAAAFFVDSFELGLSRLGRGVLAAFERVGSLLLPLGELYTWFPKELTAVDLDNDGESEILLFESGSSRAVIREELRVAKRIGGQYRWVLETKLSEDYRRIWAGLDKMTVRQVSWSLQDVDGDGKKEIVIEGTEIDYRCDEKDSIGYCNNSTAINKRVLKEVWKWDPRASRYSKVAIR